MVNVRRTNDDPVRSVRIDDRLHIRTMGRANTEFILCLYKDDFWGRESALRSKGSWGLGHTRTTIRDLVLGDDLRNCCHVWRPC